MQKINFSVLANANNRFFIFYFLFLFAYFINFNRDHQYGLYALLLLSSVPTVWANRRVLLLSRPLRWAGALLLYLTVSFFWSDHDGPAYFFEALSKAFLTLSFLFITAWFVWKYPQQFATVLRLMIVLVALIGLLSIVLFYTKNPFPEARLVSFGQLNNASFMGSMNGAFAVITSYFTVTAKSIRARVLYSAIFIVLLSIVMMAQSRGAFIAMLSGIAVLIMWQRKSFSTWYSLVISAVVGLYIFGKPLFSRLSTAGVDLTSDLRLQIWHDALAQISTHPLIGFGFGSTMQFTTSDGLFPHTHSVYLSIAWYGGIIGLCLLVAMLVVAFRECIFAGRQHGNYLALALLAYSSICVLVDYSEVMTFPHDMWIVFWLPIAVAGGLALGNRLDHLNVQER